MSYVLGNENCMLCFTLHVINISTTTAMREGDVAHWLSALLLRQACMRPGFEPR